MLGVIGFRSFLPNDLLHMPITIPCPSIWVLLVTGHITAHHIQGYQRGTLILGTPHIQLEYNLPSGPSLLFWVPQNSICTSV